jgi:hypothetical protein
MDPASLHRVSAFQGRIIQRVEQAGGKAGLIERADGIGMPGRVGSRQACGEAAGTGEGWKRGKMP